MFVVASDNILILRYSFIAISMSYWLENLDKFEENEQFLVENVQTDHLALAERNWNTFIGTSISF